MAKQYKAPNGLVIEGTLEKLSGRAILSTINDDGEPNYVGETEVWWDEQRTVEREGKAIFLDSFGNEWTFDQLEPIEGTELLHLERSTTPSGASGLAQPRLTRSVKCGGK